MLLILKLFSKRGIFKIKNQCYWNYAPNFKNMSYATKEIIGVFIFHSKHVILYLKVSEMRPETSQTSKMELFEKIGF